MLKLEVISISNNNNNKSTLDLIHTQSNLKLLATYLSKRFGRNKAQQLLNQFTAKSNESNHDYLFGSNSLAYELGRRDIEFFSIYYLQNIFLPKPDNEARQLSPTHLKVWKLIEDCLIHDKFDKLVLCLPRGFAKTTFATWATVIHQALYNTSTGFYQIIMGRTEADAQNFIFDVRKELEENPYILHTFGELINSRKFTVNKNDLHLTNNCKIQAISSTSSMRGRKHLGKRPSAIYLDDTQGLVDVITQEAKQKKMEVFQKDILYAGDEAVIRDGKKVKASTKFIVSGTILASDCFISRLLKDRSYTSIVKRAILVDDVDELFSNEYWSTFRDIYYDNKNEYAEADAKAYYYDNIDKMKYDVLWEDKWDCIELALRYYSDPASFKQEMMNQASLLTGQKCFFNIKTMTPEELSEVEYERTMITVDCAVETGSHNDYSAVAVGSRSSTGHRYIRKGLIYKKEFDESVATVFDLIKQYDDVTHVMIEKNTFQGRFEAELNKLVEADEQLRKRNIKIWEKRQLSNKENRIRSISGKVNNGFVIFNEEDEEFTNQIFDYQGSKIGNDDAADVVEMLDANIDEIEEEVGSISFLPRSVLF